MDGDRMGRDPNAELYRVLIETADHPDTPLVVVAELAVALSTVVAKRLVSGSPLGITANRCQRSMEEVVAGIHASIERGDMPDDRWLAPAEDQYRNYTADDT